MPTGWCPPAQDLESGWRRLVATRLDGDKLSPPQSSAFVATSERGCVRRGPAAAAPKTRRHPLDSEASPAANVLRLVLRAHSRAPEEILRGSRGFWRAGGPSPQRPRTREGATNLQRPGSGVAAAAGTAALRWGSGWPGGRNPVGIQRWTRSPRGAAFTPLHRSNAEACPNLPAPLTLKRHKCRAPNSSRHARIPERGRPARSSYVPAKAQEIPNAPAPVLPLRPGRPRSGGVPAGREAGIPLGFSDGPAAQGARRLRRFIVRTPKRVRTCPHLSR